MCGGPCGALPYYSHNSCCFSLSDDVFNFLWWSKMFTNAVYLLLHCTVFYLGLDQFDIRKLYFHWRCTDETSYMPIPFQLNLVKWSNLMWMIIRSWSTYLISLAKKNDAFLRFNQCAFCFKILYFYCWTFDKPSLLSAQYPVLASNLVIF